MHEVPLAHALWFTETRPPFDAGFPLGTLSLLALAGAVVGAALWRLVARRFWW